MAYASLADFLEELGHAGELLRVGCEVDPSLEVAEISQRIATFGGKALLFGALRDRQFSLVTNLLASEARLGRALGVARLEELTDRVAQLVYAPAADGWMEKIKALPSRAELRKLEPRTVRSGACQQVVRLGGDVDLTRLPALQCRPSELGGVLTTGQLVVATADTASRRVGCHPLRIVDRHRLVVGWLPEDDAARCWEGYRERQERMPVAVAFGGDPAAWLAAMAPLPPDSDRLAFAGLLRAKPLDLVRCRTCELEVPADAELVLEGYLDPKEPAEETGPLAASGGYELPSRPMPVMQVTALTHRSNPVLPALVPGRAGDEATLLVRLLHRVFRPLVQASVPELVDYELPAFATGARVAFVSIQKSYAGQARKVAGALWGLRQLMAVKLLVLVDRELDVRDPQQVWAAVASEVDFGRDLIVSSGPPDLSDPAALPGALGQRLAIDATRKLPQEGLRQSPPSAELPEGVRRLVSRRWAEYGLGDLR